MHSRSEKIEPTLPFLCDLVFVARRQVSNDFVCVHTTRLLSTSFRSWCGTRKSLYEMICERNC